MSHMLRKALGGDLSIKYENGDTGTFLDPPVERSKLAFADGGGGSKYRLDIYNGQGISHDQFIKDMTEYIEDNNFDFYPWDSLLEMLPDTLSRLAECVCPPHHGMHQLNSDEHVMAVAYAAIGSDYKMFNDYYLMGGSDIILKGQKEDIFWVALTHDLGKADTAEHKLFDDGSRSDVKFSFPDHERRSGEIVQRMAQDYLRLPWNWTGSWIHNPREGRYIVSNNIVYWHGEIRTDTQRKKGRSIDAKYLVGGQHVSKGIRGVLEPWDYGLEPIWDERSCDSTSVPQDEFGDRQTVFQRYLIQTICDGLGFSPHGLKRVLKEVKRLRDSFMEQFMRRSSND